MVKVNHRHHREPAVYTVTDAPRPMSEDIGNRQRRYLISMGVRTACFLGAVAAAVAGAPWWLALLMVVGAAVLPYVAVIFANGGREPTASAAFDDPARRAQKPVSGQRPEIRS
ncbi:DUF3099 domain-containing protein [Actinomadura madurae]|uniref:DUF3099 domain-containing protein n=2 Tax=Actinomadura madurae TaxID=1993 RepID=A0A1I5K582_9ACTN|nr:DUF3099 domain-containing protein [Actinomadura madurae]MCP9947860.1 DUF3099 domain-containing protein [Actinomadura madurae]MCP9977104.1 DUF3099 domain-containing protein [Actinomadura madurae]MCQ0011384.1 DUF3099 domain-containing protein [Actinomadura madurae]URM93527.1 DUF3099 domain-containing protein [Actinomadura madurae]URN04246.1 DUF3099 domain-containing protein [Actinomadura madurae]